MLIKKIISFFQIVFILIALLITSYSYGKSESGIKKLDRIIAVVDQDVITEKELQEKINSVISNLKSQKIKFFFNSSQIQLNYMISFDYFKI